MTVGADELESEARWLLRERYGVTEPPDEMLELAVLAVRGLLPTDELAVAIWRAGFGD